MFHTNVDIYIRVKEMQQKIKDPEFAARMQQACDGKPDVPPANYGRLGWFVEQLEKKYGEHSTIETVRRWLSGESRPRRHKIMHLAEILKVDPVWLEAGLASDVSVKERRLRNYDADGSVNLVAGLIQMSGWNPAFPEDEGPDVDILAVIRGAAYKFHIVSGAKVGDDWVFNVPTQALDCVVVGLVRDAEFTFRFFELDSETIKEKSNRKSGYYEVALSQHDWNQITTFADRI